MNPDPCATDLSFRTPSIIALQQHHPEMFNDLEEAEKTKCEWKISCIGGPFRITSNLLSAIFTKGKFTSSQNEKISPALIDAISNGDLKLCQQVIQRGFSIDGICECGCTALVKACLQNRVLIALYLLQLGAPVKGVACVKESNSEGLSALQLVALTGELELFERIFSQGNFTSEETTQAFYLAASRGRVHILRVLLEHAEEKRPLLEAKRRRSQSAKNEKTVYIQWGARICSPAPRCCL